ncbi:O-antigen ligase domain-containing protein [Pseudomonas sp. LTJR-52]|nr:O-antigen ligase domain-containing protein [Pseudomonas sp. LTJR-52]
MLVVFSRSYCFIYLLAFIGGSLFFRMHDIAWHDSQRIAEISFFWVASLAILFFDKRDFFVDTKITFFLSAFFFIGLFSSLFSNQPVWALVELALFLGCFGFYLYISSMRNALGEKADWAFLVLILLIVVVKAVQFFSSYIAACFSGDEALDVWLLADGFSNIRHYGQFQTFMLSILVFLTFPIDGKRFYSIAAFVLLVLFWVIVIACGTRGTWLGIACAGALIFLISSVGRFWFLIQAGAACIALLVYFCLFHIITDALHITILQSAANRITTSLSSRDIIWEKAIGMIMAHPFLGVGPMHFADTYNPVAAHPHQAFLQIACEWGIPALIILIVLLVKFFKFSFLVARSADLKKRDSVLQVSLIAGLWAALVQSMVDGVIVMPYSQLWLMIFAGWLNGSCASSYAEIDKRCANTLKIVLLSSSLFLVFIVFRDINHLDWMKEGGQKNEWGYFQPRFWSQGIIAIPESRL